MESSGTFGLNEEAINSVVNCSPSLQIGYVDDPFHIVTAATPFLVSGDVSISNASTGCCESQLNSSVGCDGTDIAIDTNNVVDNSSPKKFGCDTDHRQYAVTAPISSVVPVTIMHTACSCNDVDNKVNKPIWSPLFKALPCNAGTYSP